MVQLREATLSVERKRICREQPHCARDAAVQDEAHPSGCQTKQRRHLLVSGWVDQGPLREAASVLQFWPLASIAVLAKALLCVTGCVTVSHAAGLRGITQS